MRKANDFLGGESTELVASAKLFTSGWRFSRRFCRVSFCTKSAFSGEIEICNADLQNHKERIVEFGLGGCLKFGIRHVHGPHAASLHSVTAIGTENILNSKRP